MRHVFCIAIASAQLFVTAGARAQSDPDKFSSDLLEIWNRNDSAQNKATSLRDDSPGILDSSGGRPIGSRSPAGTSLTPNIDQLLRRYGNHVQPLPDASNLGDPAARGQGTTPTAYAPLATDAWKSISTTTFGNKGGKKGGHDGEGGNGGGCTPPTPTPEPASLILMGLGAGTAGAIRNLRSRRRV